MDLGLQGKTALVTGGSRGIGRAIAHGLAAEGVRVAIAGRGEEAIAQVVSELAALRANASEPPIGVVADVASREGAERAVDEATRGFGHLDILVNNVGGSLGSGTFDKATAEDWARVLDLNLSSAVWCSQRVLTSMRARGGGVILHVGSICGLEYCSSGPYTAAKAAMVGLTKEMGIDLAAHKIRVASVAPGSVLFPGGSWDRRLKADPEAIAKKVRDELPFGRFGTPEEIANVVVFLCSDRASWVSGTTVRKGALTDLQRARRESRLDTEPSPNGPRSPRLGTSYQPEVILVARDADNASYNRRVTNAVSLRL
jgi:3-oxoacyl-[acyl-carrier protein] reductase